jgi:tellurite resistance protein TerA
VVAEVGKARASEVRHVLSEDSPTREVLLADLSGAMRVALVWKPRVNAAGVRLSSDLHLGGLWQTRARDEGIIQALGDHVAAPGYGARQVARMGPRSEDREEMVVDTKHLPVFRRFFLYAYTSRDEVADWASYDPELRIEERSGATTTVPVELAPSGAGSVMALSVHVLEDRLVLRREDEVGRRTRDLAASYGFDVEWDTSGRSTRA